MDDKNQDHAGDVPVESGDSSETRESALESLEALSGSGTPGPGLAAQQEALRARVAKESAQKVVPHPTVPERQRKGRLARAATPREDLGVWQAPADRADPVALLTGQEGSRVAELVPVRHARMATSGFAFYRGAALVMAADLATRPRSGLQVQLCGDAHLSNFGLFAAPDRSVIFDVNDFDETNPGPFEWDVQRLATSFVLAARDNAMTDKAGAEAAQMVCSSYRQSMAKFAQQREVDIWYERVDATELLNATQAPSSGAKALKAKDQAKAQEAVAGATSKARLRDAWSAVAKITEIVDGHRQFRQDPPLLVRLAVSDEVRAVVNSLFREYRATLQDDRQELLKRYEIVDVGHKVVGVGSVGLLAFVLLLRGRDEDDLMVLQVKQAQASVLEAFTHASVFTKHGHRVVTGQRLMQAASDSFLGWIDGPMGRSFYVRQLRDMKWSPDPASLTGKALPAYAALCGLTLARAHARSGDAVAMAAYLGNGAAFDKATTAFAVSYADQAAQDFAAFTAAIDDGRLIAHEDSGGAESVTAARQMAEPKRGKKPTKKTKTT